MVLTTVMYHYVRDLPGSRFPRIKGMLTDAFRRQVAFLKDQYEMVDLESALAFIRGDYQPTRNLCLLTFDDGLKDHLTAVLPILTEQHIQGIFFVSTSYLDRCEVSSVHKNQILMAAVPFEEYRQEALVKLRELAPEISTEVSAEHVCKTYRWDAPEVAAFKYLINFVLSDTLRQRLLNHLFERYVGSEQVMAQEWYLSWQDAQQLQDAGMVIGGHAHQHNVALSALNDNAQRQDLERCASLLRSRLKPQTLWPFAYPWGKPDTFTPATVELLQRLGFCCAFTTVVGTDESGADCFRLRRLDPKDVPMKMSLATSSSEMDGKFQKMPVR